MGNKGKSISLRLEQLFLMCKRKKGLSEDKILHFLSFFDLWGQIIYFVFRRGTGEEFGTRGYLGKILCCFPRPFLYNSLLETLSTYIRRSLTLT